MRKVISMLIVCIMLLGINFSGEIPIMEKADAKAGYSNEVRGVWVAFCDFYSLGLKDKGKSTYRKNVIKFLNKAKENKINRVYLHVRAFDDALWKSNTFKGCSYLSGRASSKKTAAKTYTYDPLQIFIAEAHSKGIKIEGYMNPYRITYDKFLNPASSNSTARINKAVEELKSYDLDGIHFDDYFYHSKKWYVTPSDGSKYSLKVTGSSTTKRPSAKKKRKYVNAMLRSVKTNVKEKSGAIFGVSPAGNYENCMSSGADVKTWLGEEGATYVDYVIPQLYWTNRWGYKGKIKMYSSRLNTFVKLWKNKSVNLYIGLGSYRASANDSGDRGWHLSKQNLAKQVKELREKGARGYVLFEGKDLFRAGAKKELYYLKRFLLFNKIDKIAKKTARIKRLKFKYAKITIKKGRTKKLKINWKQVCKKKKYVKFRTSNRRIVTVSRYGKIRAKRRRGTATIIAWTKTGKVARCKIRVR